MNWVYRKLHIIEKKNISQITFYFVDEGPGCGSEDIKKEGILIFSSFLSF